MFGYGENGGGLKVHPRNAAVYTATTSSRVGVIWLVDMQVSCSASSASSAKSAGSTLFSCTDGFARYLLTKEEWILQVLDKTFCSDEFFVQTLIAQSPYQDKIYQGPGDTSARAIDWDRGNPWVWKYADLEQLKASPCMFARKFDIEKEPELVHEIERLYAPHI